MPKSTPRAGSPKAKRRKRNLSALERVQRGAAQPGEYIWEPGVPYAPLKLQVSRVVWLSYGGLGYYTDYGLSFAADCRPWTPLLELLYSE